jgi:hypothetical protein
MVVFKFILLCLTAIDVNVVSLDGSSVDGQLSKLNAEAVSVTDQAGQTHDVSLADVVELRFPEVSQDSATGLQLLLNDESQIPCNDLTVTATQATGNSDWLADINVPRSAVRAIRIQELQPEWQAEWNAFLARENQKDLLIRARRDGSGLDFVDGIVSSVTAEQVQFLLDGNEIPVPRERLFGIVFARPTAASVLNGTTVIQGAAQALIRARGVSLAGDKLEIVSSWGQKHALELNRIGSIDFSSGRFQYLSDQEPIREQYSGIAPEGQSAGLFTPEEEATRTGNAALYRMSRDAFPYGSGGRPPLMLRGKTYRKGLCIFPRARIDYALDGRYSSLVALAGVDDEVAFNSPLSGPPWAVLLRIEGDGKKLWEQLIAAPQDPIPLDIDLTGVQTLSLIVDFGDGERFCDYLDLVDARLIVDTSK